LQIIDAKVHFSKSKRTSPYGGIGSTSDLIKILKAIAKSDVLLCHQVYNLQNAFLIPWARFLKKPIALMPHGTLTEYQIRKTSLKKKIVSPYFMFLLKFWTTRIFVATNKEFFELQPRLRNKALVVGLGLKPIERIIPRKPRTDTFNFLSLGRITEKKRIDIALNSFAKLRRLTQEKVHFNICGTGDKTLVDTLKRTIFDLNLSENVSLLGWKTGEDKIAIMESSDCFVLTSEDENFAIAVAEALQGGIPVIVSKQVALSNVVEEFGAGITFQDLDTDEISMIMLEILRLNQESLRQSALRASEQFSWDKISIIWSDALQEIALKR
jgi:glycosyltransferase involved in cell wall biosynthesis